MYISFFELSPITFQGHRKNDHTSTIADRAETTIRHNIKWDNFEILASGNLNNHCKIKETFYKQDLEPPFNVSINGEKLMLY